MNVFGRKPVRGKGSVSNICNPCSVSKGHQVPANGYCQDCGHFLCQKCFDAHTIPLLLKDHRLLDASSMPKSSSTSGAKATVTSTLTCSKHSHKYVEFYCLQHRDAMCGSCAHKHHNRCTTEDINEVAGDFDQRQQCSNVTRAYDQVEREIVTIKDNATSNIRTTKQSNNAAIDKIRQAKSKIVADLDKMEKEFISAAKEMCNQDKQSLTTVQAECDALFDEVTQQKADLKKYKNNTHDLYVISMKATAILDQIQGQIDQISAKNVATTYSFSPDENLTLILASTKQIGTLKRSDNKPTASRPREQRKSAAKLQTVQLTKQTSKPMKYVDLGKSTLKQKKDINVKDKKDTFPCNITGAVLLHPNRMLLVDVNNNSVKCMDTVINTITSRLQLPDVPWDVTKIPDDQAAITLLSLGQVQVISTKEPLSLLHTFKVSHRCHGIAFTNDKLVVSSTGSPNKVEIMDHHGAMLHTISSHNNSQVELNVPHYVAVSKVEGQEYIYISNMSDHNVIKTSMEGRVLFTYTDKDLFYPHGLATTSDDQLLVCSQDNHQIHLVSVKGKKTRTLLTKKDGIQHPQSVILCTEKKILYVIEGGSNNMKVFELE